MRLLVLLLAASCSRNLINPISHKSTLTNVLRNQLPPLLVSGASDTTPLNLNHNDSETTTSFVIEDNFDNLRPNQLPGALKG